MSFWNVFNEFLDLFIGISDLKRNEEENRNRDLDYIEVYRTELERNREFDAKIETQRKERYESRNKDGKMDEI